MELVYLLLGLLAVTNLMVLFWLYRLSSHYNSLTRGIDKKTLRNALEGIQKTLANHERLLAVSKKEIKGFREESKYQLRHLIFKRFNPFNDTGGDQSFMLAIMDGNKDGVVITSLHSRENTRFYVKSVKAGEGIEHPLSREEHKLLNT